MPAFKTVILHKDAKGKDFDKSFHYHSVLGKLNYLEKSMRPEIAYVVHQCTCFSSCPKPSHAEAVKWIGDRQIFMRHEGDRNYYLT